MVGAADTLRMAVLATVSDSSHQEQAQNLVRAAENATQCVAQLSAAARTAESSGRKRSAQQVRQRTKRKKPEKREKNKKGKREVNTVLVCLIFSFLFCFSFSIYSLLFL